MNNYRYSLEKYNGVKSRYLCPNCNEKRFTFYIDTLTGERLHSTVGKCDRENNCSYHYTPSQYFKDNNISLDKNVVSSLPINKIQATAPKQTSFIDNDVFTASLKGYDRNNFTIYLNNLFGRDTANELIKKYCIGTSKHWENATVFWQKDLQGNTRTGKIMLYNPNTGNRIKEPFNHIHWVHKALHEANYNLKQCFFGEQLLSDTSKPIAIVESEAAAIISSVFLPQFIWLASGSKQGINEEKFKVLKNRTVVLFPDLGCFEFWENKAKEFQHIANIQVSNLIESVALKSEIEQGFDIADYLIKMDCNQFYIKEVLRDFNYWLKTNTSGGVYSCHGEQFNVSLKHCLN